jgi:FkbM family methyltransferase
MRHSAAVHAFEPNPSVYAILKRRVDGLGGRVTTHSVALSNATGGTELRIPNRGLGFVHSRASLNGVAVTENYTGTLIQTARLDDLDIANVGFIKIDAEGSERQVIEGAAETIRRDRPNLLIELEETHTKVPLADMVAFVCSFGYDCLVLLEGVLTPFAVYAMARNHRREEGTLRAVNNFIFLPNRG